MTEFIAILSMVVFFGMLWLLDLRRVGSSVLVISRDAFVVLRDDKVDDARRETAARRAAIRLGGAFISIAVRGAISFIASIMPIYLADRFELAAADDAVAFLMRWDVVLTVTIVFLAAIFVGGRLKGTV
jgi:hypothetical protein